MPYMLVRAKVEDYEKWKPGFEEHGTTRQERGSKGGRLFRSADDPNEVAIVLEWDNLENARQFAQSEDLRDLWDEDVATAVDMLSRGRVDGKPLLTTRVSLERIEEGFAALEDSAAGALKVLVTPDAAHT